MDYNSLPEEIYIKIFSHISPMDIQSLTLTCNYFNRIISNSMKLLKHYEICIDSQSINKLTNLGDRKYSRFKLNGPIDNKMLENIFEKFKNSMQVIQFDQMKVDEDLLVKILSFCDNLKQISFSKFELLDFETSEENLQLPTFDIKNFIIISSDLTVLKLFRSSKIKNLYIRDSKFSNWTILNDITNFENLTIFKPENSRFVSSFSNITIQNVKKLRLININFKKSLIPFDVETLNIDKLILEYVNNCADFLIKILQKDSTKLKLLRSIGIAYDGIACNVVKKNCHKVENVESSFKIPLTKLVAFGNTTLLKD
ncbi:unnamed protein product [Chironomus riparius]|uniref:F-box domain-containing protein n=1 Tax=Chironomus riparius TaxID=315576 RepID=A0A9N9SB19_9DIPT|nr:unnamed protein product [Chironomus riparius]